MALFNHQFPYSNLHDINLDWIISIIKSIDPAVIQALQELTPDIIEQVTQKVNEAQAAAIAAQSSASEANTAKDNAVASAAEAAQEATEAAADAALANADAIRAENAKTAVENSLNPIDLSATITAVGNGSVYSGACFISGKIGWVQIFGTLNDANAYYKINLPSGVTIPYNRILSYVGERNGWTSPVLESDGKITLGDFYGGGATFGCFMIN